MSKAPSQATERLSDQAARRPLVLEVFHQYNECYLYLSFMSQEVDPRIKAIWELHLAMELEHLRLACEMMQRYEGVEPEEILPAQLPELRSSPRTRSTCGRC